MTHAIFPGLQAGRYGALYCDPPWAFEAYRNKAAIAQRSAESHYKVEGVDALATLPVLDLAAKDCALFMWVVDSHLDQGVALMERWGFSYKTIAFVWVKTTLAGDPRMGMGLWTRKMSEICIMGTRGKPTRNDKGVRQVIMAPRREHSRKPDEVRERIERLVAGPYAELFARSSAPGWDRWGDQSTKFDLKEAA